MEDEHCLTPWLPQRQRIFDGESQHPSLQGGKSGERGFNVPNILLSAPSSPASGGSITASPDLGFDTPSSVSRTLGDETSSPVTGPESPSTRTFVIAHTRNTTDDADTWAEKDVSRALAGSTSNTGNVPGGALLISSAEASPARTSPSPDVEQDSQEPAPASFTNSHESLNLFDLDGFSSRTYPDCSPRTAVGTSESCLQRWPTSGTAWRGGLSTAVSSECRSDEGGCSSSEPSLSQILEEPQNVPAKYSLSARAAQGILRRAQKRGRTLPSHLSAALDQVAQTTTTGREVV